MTQRVAGVDGEQPAGTYVVETTEQQVDNLSVIAYRRVSTTIILSCRQFGPASRQVVTIDPLDLEAALARDAIYAHDPILLGRAANIAPRVVRPSKA